MEEIHLAYRTEAFSLFVHTLREVGRSQYDLNVETTLVRGVEDAERDLAGGEIDVIIGHHYAPFVSKITGLNLTWLAIAQNTVDYKLVTRPGVRSFEELKGKSVAISRNLCTGINMQLMLKQMGIEDDVTVVKDERRERRGYGPLLDFLESGEVDAAFVGVPADLEAKRRGFVVHEETPTLDIVAGECITTIPRTITEKDTTLRAFMKSYLHAVSIFKTKHDYVKEMVRNNPKLRNEFSNRHKKFNTAFKTHDEELLDRYIEQRSSRWEKKPYPNLKALANTHEKATRFDARCAAVNPLTITDTHYVKELDESGFIDQLYK